MRRWAVAVAIAAGLGLGACGGDDVPASAPVGGADEHGEDEPAVVTFAPDQATSEVTTVLTDYAFVGVPASVEGPNVLFLATVRGANVHELVIVDGKGARRAALGPFAADDGERTLAAVLEPGSYTLQCLVKEGTRTHAQLGMRRALTVATSGR